MIEPFFIGQNDTLPYYRAVVRDKDGVVNLSQVTAAYFGMIRISTGSLIVSAAAVITSEIAGEVEYRWAVADTGSTGEFAAAFLFVAAGGATFSLPRNTIAKVTVEDRYATE